MTASAKTSSSTTIRTTRVPASSRRREITLAGRTARDVEVATSKRSVPDPFEPGSFLTATVNRKVDLLADERSKGRITEAQFLVGRMIQAVYERGSGARLGSAGWDVGGSRDQTVAHELAILYAIDDAEKVTRFTADMEAVIGSMGVRFLRAMLTEGHSFGSYAMARGRGHSERASTEIAQRFRWLLEQVTEGLHKATGADRQRIRAHRSRD